MVPFAYAYHQHLIARIKNAIDDERYLKARQPNHPMPRIVRRPLTIKIAPALTRAVRQLADARANTLGQLGIRLLLNYHSLIRAHAVLNRRRTVTKDDLTFLRSVDRFVSISDCRNLELGGANGQS